MKIILRRISFAALVFLGTVFLYLPSTRYAFIDHDDPEYVIDNPNMREGLTWENVKWAFTSVGYANNWHPLAWISMMMDVTLVGPLDDETWNRRDNRVAHVMHLHNILLHASNAVLLFFLLGLFLEKGGDTKGDALRLLLTLFWAVHPLRCEVVCWCSERKELTSVFFMLSSLIAYLHPASGTIRRYVNYWGSFVLFALAILAKPVAITLPTVMFAWNWIFKGKPRWLKITPFILLSLACCFLTMSSQKGALESGADQLICQRLESVFVAPLVYIRQTFWPSGLSCFYKLTYTMNWVGVCFGILLVLIMVWVCVRWLRRREPWAAIASFGVVWLYVGLLPMLGVVKVGSQEHADRYTYWISCGLCVIIVLCWNQAKESLRLRRCGSSVLPYLSKASFLGVLLLAYLTHLQMGAWRDTITLLRDSLPKSWNGRVAGILASHLESTGKLEDRQEAERWLRETITYRASTVACAELAMFLSHQTHVKCNIGGQEPYAEARYWARRSLDGCKDQAVAWEALGNCDLAEGKWEDAIKNFENAMPYSMKTERIQQKMTVCLQKLTAEKRR